MSSYTKFRFKQKYRKPNVPVDTKKCIRGNYWHEYGQCRAYNAQCNTCGIKGHFSASPLCRRNIGKRVHSVLEQTDFANEKENTVHQLQEFHIDDALHVIEEKVDVNDTILQVVSLQICTFRVNFTLDIGLFVNNISGQLLQTLGYESMMIPIKKNISLMNGAMLLAIGEILLYVKYKNQIFQLAFL